MDPSMFTWISRSPIAAWVNSSGLIWPTLESIHLGSLLIIDLRLIGFYRDRCASTVEALVRLSLAAFGVNFLTGALFFAGNTPKYLNNSAFTLKLILIALAGLNAIYYRVRLSSLVDTNEVTRASIGVGYLSLFLWTGVIICGRMITFYAR